ncbi:hypothetical protein KUTeg_019217 [Tegillarca granosa]|uniref:CUB domain-containing protein n=1 Tax=Tegillarca granosa TaxID=220873 RepID=A0ABQ9EEG9_TEGGR|nr:hypothetical protein KUTeg_019217 [Tegillarca granosa]
MRRRSTHKCGVAYMRRKAYATENCGHVIGPDYGAFIEFDRDAKEKKGTISVPEHLKGSVLECLIVIRGMPATSTTRKRYMAMHWKEFYLRDQSVATIQSTPEDCKKAYVIMYAGMDRTAPNLGTYCGKDILVRNFEFIGEYITLFFYADYRNPKLQITPTSNSTTKKPPKIPEDTFPYPLAFFKLDVTSFDYGKICSKVFCL